MMLWKETSIAFEALGGGTSLSTNSVMTPRVPSDWHMSPVRLKPVHSFTVLPPPRTTFPAMSQNRTPMT